MKQKTIQQGAEAHIILDKNEIIKRRVKKSYRHPKIDEKIRKLRTRSETKLLEKASKIIDIPKIKKVDEKNKEILMEFICGKKLSDSLDSFSLKKQKEICRTIGKNISKLHHENIIHGDLTTSNLIFVEKESKVFFIDFGLGFISQKIEDRAVDLHLLKQALEAKHYKNWEVLFEEITKGYNEGPIKKECQKIFERISAVEKRGRYKGSH